MKAMDMNAFMQEVHDNAVSHGWWDEDRSAGTIRSLFHCELSEAMEEYRAKRPMLWHGCCNTNTIVPCEEHACSEYWTNSCAIGCRLPKPEGIAVELMDFVIRVLDYMGKMDIMFLSSMDTAEKLAEWAADDFQMDADGSVLDLDLPDFVDVLHSEIALSDVLHNETYLTTAAGLAIAWVNKRGLDPVAIPAEKHEYNKTRPYKHGNKIC